MFHSVPMVYAEVNSEPNDVMEDFKDKSTKFFWVELVSKVVQVPPLAIYYFQKHKATTQDDSEPKTKKTTTSSLLGVNVGELNPNLI